MAHPLQRLLDACSQTFVVRPPPPEGLQHVKSLLDAMTLSDLGLSEEILAQDDSQLVSYRHIHQSENFSMGIFYLPPTIVIPLHDHPEMTVLSKLLHGSMHVKSYDWVDPLAKTSTWKARLASLVVEQVFTAPWDSFILYPTSGGNIHALSGVTGCAMLDVLAPPYSISEGRPCTYYQDSLYSSKSDVIDGTRLAWLEVLQTASDNVRWVQYEPPTIFF